MLEPSRGARLALEALDEVGVERADVGVAQPDPIMIQRANGKKTPVQPTDVAVAMGKALRGKTPAERIGVIETNAVSGRPRALASSIAR